MSRLGIERDGDAPSVHGHKVLRITARIGKCLTARDTISAEPSALLAGAVKAIPAYRVPRRTVCHFRLRARANRRFRAVRSCLVSGRKGVFLAPVLDTPLGAKSSSYRPIFARISS